MLILTISGFIVILLVHKARSKRIAHRSTIIGGAILFLCFLPSLAHEQHWGSLDLLFIVPIALLIFWTHIRFYTWCDHCRRSVSNMNHPFQRMASCPHCGALLPSPL
jgi:hypothetical protein